MSSVMPQPKRQVDVDIVNEWRVPHKVGDARLYTFGLFHNPRRFDFVVNRPTDGEEWPKTGEFLPSVEALHYVPGIDGERDASSNMFAGSIGPGSRKATLESRGWLLIPRGDPRLGDERWYVCKIPGVGGALHHCAWDYAERIGDDVQWHVDESLYTAFRRLVAGIVPKMTLSAYNTLMSDLRLRRDRRLERATRSDVAAALYTDSRETVLQAERTWAAYSVANAQPMVRLAPRRVVAE